MALFKKKPDPENDLYGVLKYSSNNIGDEIQSIAAMRFIPHVDYYCHRERLDQFHIEDEEQQGKKVKLIMNAWWMWEPQHFPPSEDIDPLMISMHFAPAHQEGFERPEVFKYMKKHGPVGCRDTESQKFLEENGVPAYFSGCLTSTLIGNPKFRENNKHDYILCVETGKKVVDEIKARTDRPVYSVNRMLSAAFTFEERLEIAKVQLALYHNAHCVVTPRMHAALPATAFGTPVCFLNKYLDKPGELFVRISGMEDCFNQITPDEFMENRNAYNLDNPPKNPEKYLEISEDLAKRCTEFTGYDSKKSIFEDDYEPLIAMMNCLNADYNKDRRVINKMLYFAKKSEVSSMLKQKKENKVNRHDNPY